MQPSLAERVPRLVAAHLRAVLLGLLLVLTTGPAATSAASATPSAGRAVTSHAVPAPGAGVRAVRESSIPRGSLRIASAVRARTAAPAAASTVEHAPTVKHLAAPGASRSSSSPSHLYGLPPDLRGPPTEAAPPAPAGTDAAGAASARPEPGAARAPPASA